ncbi:MAG TPA: hypothetical protein VGR35_19715 [Tepidisphaeraceae bacterium]|nr:hypothetical protein [Tepidisphaeraceae bacterium]
MMSGGRSAPSSATVVERDVEPLGAAGVVDGIGARPAAEVVGVGVPRAEQIIAAAAVDFVHARAGVERVIGLPAVDRILTTATEDEGRDVVTDV